MPDTLTVTVEEPPDAATPLIEMGVTEAATPAFCVTVTTVPAIVAVPVRADDVVFEEKLSATVPVVVEQLQDPIEIQGAFETAVQELDSVPDTLTVTVEDAPDAATLPMVTGLTETAPGAFWFTVTVFPAIVAVPDRADDVVLAAKFSVAVPVAREQSHDPTEIQGAFETADQLLDSVPDTVTVIACEPPDAATLSTVAGLTETDPPAL